MSGARPGAGGPGRGGSHEVGLTSIGNAITLNENYSHYHLQ